MLKQFIAMKKTIKFNKTNLYKIFIKNQFNKLEKVKKQNYIYIIIFRRRFIKSYYKRLEFYNSYKLNY